KLVCHGSIYRWYDDQINALTNEQQMLSLLNWVAESIWPGGVFYTMANPELASAAEPTPDQEQRVQAEARRLLLSSIPASLTRLLGKQACQDAAVKYAPVLPSSALYRRPTSTSFLLCWLVLPIVESL